MIVLNKFNIADKWEKKTRFYRKKIISSYGNNYIVTFPWFDQVALNMARGTLISYFNKFNPTVEFHIGYFMFKNSLEEVNEKVDLFLLRLNRMKSFL